MGTIISKATDGIGGLLEKAFLSPFKTMFDGSCLFSSYDWPRKCFIGEWLICFLFSSVLSALLFFYLVLKLGIFQCIGKSLCKMCWVACETYWYALQDICCFFWYKLRNTKRVNCRLHLRHHQLRDIEQCYNSSGDNDLGDTYRNLNVSRKRKSLSRRRKDRVRSSIYPSSRLGTGHHHRHVRLKTKSMSVRCMGGSQRLKSSRRVQVSKVRNVRSKTRTSKRRRLR